MVYTGHACVPSLCVFFGIRHDCHWLLTMHFAA
jgi:hypothetical protein